MAPANVDSIVKPGDVLVGKYRVERIIGAGGMGVVVAAHHLQLDDRVAIKFLLPEGVSDPGALARFEREARAAVKIKSEHVARIIDFGVLDTTGAPYLVMEYLEGVDLCHWLLQFGRASVNQAADFVIQACAALVEAHVLGIVHRDLKPANLFWQRRADGAAMIKVLDFGISKATAGKKDDVTRSQSLLGSPLYMSPEQMRTPKAVDARTDIWSLGVVLYELATRGVPFEADTLPELILKIVSETPEPVHVRVPGVPEAYSQIVARCMEKDPARRFQNVGELALALAPLAPPRCAAMVERIVGTARGTTFTPPTPLFLETQPLAATPLPGTPLPGVFTPPGHLPPFDPAVVVAPLSAPMGPSSTASSWGGTSGDRRSMPMPPAKKPYPLLIGAGVLAIGLGVLGLTQAHRLRAHRGSEPSAAAAKGARSAAIDEHPDPATTAATPLPVAVPVPAPPEPEVRRAAPRPGPVTPAPPAPKAAPPPVVAAQPAAPAPAPAPAPAAPSAPDCRVPHRFDEQGNKVFKRECL